MGHFVLRRALPQEPGGATSHHDAYGDMTPTTREPKPGAGMAWAVAGDIAREAIRDGCHLFRRRSRPLLRAERGI